MYMYMYVSAHIVLCVCPSVNRHAGNALGNAGRPSGTVRYAGDYLIFYNGKNDEATYLDLAQGNPSSLPWAAVKWSMLLPTSQFNVLLL